MGHLEDPRLTTDLTMARDFDLGISGPPLSISMDFIGSGLVEFIAGLTAALLLAAYAWWAPLLLARRAGSPRNGCCAKARSGATATPTRYVRRSATPTTRIGSRSIRRRQKSCACSDLSTWTVERFTDAAAPAVRSALGSDAAARTAGGVEPADRARRRTSRCSRRSRSTSNAGRIDLGQAVTFASAAVTTSMIAFGGLSWALDGAAAPAGAVLRLQQAMDPAGALAPGTRSAQDLPAREIRFRNVTLRLSGGTASAVLDGFDLTIPAGSSLAIVGQNGAGKTTLAKLLCRLYDPQAGAIEDRRRRPARTLRSRLVALARDGGVPGFHPLRIAAARQRCAGAARLTTSSRRRSPTPAPRISPSLDTVLARGYEGGTDLSGGQWQRIALARALVRGATRRRRGAARRTDRAARRARRSGDLRARARRHAPRDHDPDLAPLLDGAPGRPHLRARTRQSGRTRHARRTDGG